MHKIWINLNRPGFTLIVAARTNETRRKLILLHLYAFIYTFEKQEQINIRECKSLTRPFHFQFYTFATQRNTLTSMWCGVVCRFILSYMFFL